MTLLLWARFAFLLLLGAVVALCLLTAYRTRERQ